jgi:para-nitrobenzyl esterase
MMRTEERRTPKTIRWAVFVVAIFAAGSAAAQVTPVKVEGGLVRGVVEDGLTIYRGIPYAAPPIGNLRWRAPQPAQSWSGVRSGAEYGRACMQVNPAIKDLPPPSEDCLFVNVWTPAARGGERLPVMVWIHGGCFTAGTPGERLYHGEWLAKKGVVVVSVGYRLGAFGFLAHPELSKEDEHGVSGNYGLLDMVAGLQWVRKNIGAFGGDPGRVTIFGESAGAIAVSQLAVSPLAKGLFHGAISQSGGSFGPVSATGGSGENMRPLDVAERDGAAWATATGASSLAALRALPADRVLAASQGQRGVSWPVTDGHVIPDDQYRLYAAGRFHDVPVLIGYNSDEGATFGAPASQQAYVDSVRQRYGTFAEQLLAAYPGGDTPAARKTARDLTRDTAHLDVGAAAAAGRPVEGVRLLLRRAPRVRGRFSARGLRVGARVRTSLLVPATAGAQPPARHAQGRERVGHAANLLDELRENGRPEWRRRARLACIHRKRAADAAPGVREDSARAAGQRDRVEGAR